MRLKGWSTDFASSTASCARRSGLLEGAQLAQAQDEPGSGMHRRQERQTEALQAQLAHEALHVGRAGSRWRARTDRGRSRSGRGSCSPPPGARGRRAPGRWPGRAARTRARARDRRAGGDRRPDRRRPGPAVPGRRAAPARASAVAELVEDALVLSEGKEDGAQLAPEIDAQLELARVPREGRAAPPAPASKHWALSRYAERARARWPACRRYVTALDQSWPRRQ